MKIYIITIFPELFEPFINTGLIKKGIDNESLEFVLLNPRDFTDDKHRKVDDEPYGTGRGMVMKVEPIINAFESIPEDIRDEALVLLPSPRGERLKQSNLIVWKDYSSIIFICGRYKDIDARVLTLTNAKEISIGNYVLQGGEIPAMAIIEGVSRLLPDFLGDFDSAETDSFYDDDETLSPLSYTRPREFRGLGIPEILLSGNHAAIDDWRKKTGKILTEELKKKQFD